jgi:DNA segregation ATPase FtsK/SpoIIIE, S-DNA-T family
MNEVLGRLVADGKGARAGGVLLIALGVFCTMSLLSYSPQDYPNSSVDPAECSNWGGRVGAYLAYGSLTGIGFSAYIMPLLAFLWGWNRLRQHSAGQTALRSLGIVGMALLFSIGMGLPTYAPHWAFKLGGWFGTEISNSLLIPYGGRIGSAVMLGALFIAALVVGTDLDLRRVWALAIRGLDQLRYLGKRLGAIPGIAIAWCLGNWREWRLRRAERAAAKAVETAVAVESLSNETAVAKVETEVETEKAEPEKPVATIRLRDNGKVSAAGEASEQGLDEAAAKEPDTKSVPAPNAVKETPTIPLTPIGGAVVVQEPKRPVKDKETVPDSALAPKRKTATPAKAAPAKPTSGPKGKGRYRMPTVKLLDPVPEAGGEVDREALLTNAGMLEEALQNFDVSGKIVEVSPGPVVTRYEVEPASGVKVGRIVALSDDLARVMSAQGIRIQAPVPGKAVVGIEIANHRRETVYLREMVESKLFRKAESKLTMVLGKTIDGEPYVADLTKMPHLLVAGATGAGKSVCINCLISSILFKATPDEVRCLMIDPKVVELTMYNDIPHLLVPVITEPKKASEALKWAVAEMEVRYQKLARIGVRNLADYNNKLVKVNAEAEADGLEPEKPMPYIVVFIDEFADLMLTAPADVETSLMSLAQKSRAVGIHIILATQRPSVNVITGVIKANFPSRIAFQVASKTDSRTILDCNGAERLLGRGDMLFLPGGQGEPIRVHGAFITGEETDRLVEEIKAIGYEAEEVAVFGDHADINAEIAGRDELFDEAVQVVVENQQASTSFLQRRMKVGYSRAARLMDELEHAGIVGPAEGAKPRQIYVEPEEVGLGPAAKRGMAQG